MWLFWGSPKNADDEWSVRRWMAVVAFRFLVLEGVMMMMLLAYALMNQVALKDILGWGALIGTFTAAKVGVVTKYMHDASVDQKHVREQKGDGS